MSNVVNRTTRQFLASVNTPDFPESDWIINPDLSAVGGFPSKYWIITGNVITLQTPAQRDLTDDQEFIDAMLAQSTTEDQIFGDGIDGLLTFSVNTTLDRDRYPDILTINSGVVVDTNGYRIVARRGIVNHGTIRNNGQDAALEVGGVGATSGTIGGGGDGATGLLAVGVAAANLNTNAAPGYGGAGGAGGSSNGGIVVGGAGGAVFGDGSARVRPRRLGSALLGGDVDISTAGLFARFRGGAGGGSGGGLAAILGAGGGGGGGIVLLCGPFLFNGPTGIVEARGGDGANSLGGNGGGGGGGGGGVICAIRVATRNRGSISVAGGAGGTPTGTGVAGSSGATGRLIQFDVGSVL